MNHTAPIFVVGMPRSGTTLLASLLSAHSAIAIGPETNYFSRMWKPLTRGRGLCDWEAVETTLVQWLEKPTLQSMDLPVRQLLDTFRETWKTGTLTHRFILSHIMEQYAERRGKAIWGEKTPEHFMYVPAIKRVFPDARIIAIIRDPRDVHLSLVKVPWNRGNAFNHALQWRGYQILSQRYQNLFRGYYMTVRFEDLIRDPRSEMKRLLSGLHQRFEEDMLVRYRQEPLFDPQQEPWKKHASAPIDAANAYKWRTQMADEEIGIFSRVCGSYLTRYGYEIPGESRFRSKKALTGLDRRALLWWARTSWRVSRNRDPWTDQPMGLPQSDAMQCVD